MIAQVHDLKFIRSRLSEHSAEEFAPEPEMREAAVAVILREVSGPTVEILFIKRAEKPGDPWSGHMAFPGGHRDPEDESLRAAAERETLEEIGLDLASARYLGPLNQQRAVARGRPLNMLIAPHVFEITGNPSFTINYEVSEVVWAPLPPLVSGDLHDTEARPLAGKPTVFNGYRLAEGHFVWGLTYRMVKSFFATIDPSWEPPREI